MPPRSHTGYSLYELLATLAIAATVLTVGLPSLGRLTADNRLRAAIDPLFHAVHLARKESILRRQPVTICPSRDGLQCSQETDWSGGWILFVNTDRDHPPRRDDDELLLRVQAGDPALRVTANRRSFTLRSTTRRATNGTLVFCDRAARVPNRALVISYTGRPRVAGATPAGRPYACAD